MRARSEQELRERLDAEGFLPSQYSVGPPFRDDTLCLVETDDRWRIFFYGGGCEEARGEFADFSDASEAFLEMLAQR